VVVSLVYCGEGWLWFVVSLYFMCACVSFVELDLFVLIDSVFGIACFSQFFSFMVYHLFEVVFISFGGSVSIRFTDDYCFLGPKRVEGICWDILLFVCCFDVCFYFEFVHLLVICHYGVQELDLVWVRFMCEFNGVVYIVD